MSAWSTFKEWAFGTPKVMDNIFDKEKGLLTQVGGWVGNQQFTPQERAEFDKNMGSAVQSFAVATMNENTDRSKTRRELAVQWFKMQRWLIQLQVLCFFLDHFVFVAFEKNLNLSGDFAEITFNQAIWAVTSGIGLFFWGSHALRSSKYAKEDK